MKKIIDFINSDVVPKMEITHNEMQAYQCLGGEDFSEYSNHNNIPGAFLFIGVGNKEKKTDRPHHSSTFNIDEDCLKIGVELFKNICFAYFDKMGRRRMIMDDLDYGGRAKIGLIYPAMGWVMEPEFNAMAPKGVSIQTTRVMNGSTDKEGLNDLIIAGTKQAASLLAAIPADILMFGCTSASFCNGVEYEKNMIAEMEKEFGLPFVTTSTAVTEAAKAVGAKKVAFATPYIEDLNVLAKTYLESCEIEVLNTKGLGLLYDKDMDATPLEKIYELAKSVDVPEADAVLILCTGVRSVPIIEMLEKGSEKTCHFCNSGIHVVFSENTGY